MAPEQIRGERCTPAADVFSAGIVFYQLASGRHPFSTRERSLPQVASAIVFVSFSPGMLGALVSRLHVTGAERLTSPRLTDRCVAAVIFLTCDGALPRPAKKPAAARATITAAMPIVAPRSERPRAGGGARSITASRVAVRAGGTTVTGPLG